MPGTKAQTPAPIDRPLSRAYLREFAGWSTAYPPGMSEPTSLRLMENVMVNRDGSVRVRPGLRYLSYLTPPDDDMAVLGTTSYPTTSCVGSHESFFMADGSRAYLYAVRETTGVVGFRVLAFTPLGQVEQSLSAAGFSVPQTEAQLNFTADTTYVKYLQIDNKIFALSNAGEEMRLFTVGDSKTAKRLSSIARPDWTVGDKLTVVHPDAAWTNSGIPSAVRTNLFLNPDFSTSLDNWAVLPVNTAARSATFARDGAYSMRVNSNALRTNLVRSPLHDPNGTGATGWSNAGSTGTDNNALVISGNALRVTLNGGADFGYVYSSLFDVVAGQKYSCAFDLTSFASIDKIGMIAKFYDSAGNKISDVEVSHNITPVVGRLSTQNFTVPAGAVQMRVSPSAFSDSSNPGRHYDIKNVVVCKYGESTAMFSGASGANYFWEGTVNSSSSIYHPPQDIVVTSKVVVGAGTHTGSVYVRAGTTVRSCRLDLLALNSAGATLTTDTGSAANDVSGGWTGRTTNTITAPALTTAVTANLYILAVPRGEFHYIDSALFETAGSAGTFFSGATANSSTLRHTWLGVANAATSKEETFSAPLVNPPAETKTADTLISSTAALNVYSFGFFYTFSNEIGESAVSQVTVVKAQRPWSGWKWELPNGAGEPGGTATNDPDACADQLAAYMASDVFADAIAAGAIKWSLYMFTWSNQEPTPVTALKVASRTLDSASVYGESSWLRATPSQAEASAETSIVPTLRTRFNSSAPSRGAQGLVAADRMVLVHDPSAQAVIKWSSNRQGSYSDFSPSKGGGYKTLTSGNLYIPAVVKLWQNPQSADTLTILCQGVDGYSTGYYMSPAEISSQSESVSIMGFEETTATPGTSSPFGCEVMNNALYHPLEEQLMKSVASNYNINHSSTTDVIENMWRALQLKDRIVSCQMDNRIYFLVNNPEGEQVETGCWGNEVWVFDGMQKQGTWSRWLVQGQSLRKIEQQGRIVMSLVRPDGIYFFDELVADDEYVNESSRIVTRNIPWLMETNTQGANRAHDAWCHLQQLAIMVGNFQGTLTYGVRGWDVHGQPIDISKVVRDTALPDVLPYDLEDFLQIRRDMKEWFFYAHSNTDSEVVQPSAGQISLVQYRYSPVSVNVGYEYGSIETFEYGRADADVSVRTTDSGVPMPYIDTRRP